MEEFDIHMVPINLAVFQDKYNTLVRERAEELKQGADKLRRMYDLDKASDELAEKQYAFVLLFRELFEEFKLDAISAECWSALQLLVGAMPCTAYGILADEGYIISCEGDTHAAMTQVLLKSMSLGKKPPLFGEFTIRHPEAENTELLWHCGQFAYSVHREDQPCRCINMRENFEAKSSHYPANVTVRRDRTRTEPTFGQGSAILTHGSASSSRDRIFTMYPRLRAALQRKSKNSAGMYRI